jgi:hypothetical protein
MARLSLLRVKQGTSTKIKKGRQYAKIAVVAKTAALIRDVAWSTTARVAVAQQAFARPRSLRAMFVWLVRTN